MNEWKVTVSRPDGRAAFLSANYPGCLEHRRRHFEKRYRNFLPIESCLTRNSFCRVKLDLQRQPASTGHIDGFPVPTLSFHSLNPSAFTCSSKF